jgi:cold shock CspA family protein
MVVMAILTQFTLNSVVRARALSHQHKRRAVQFSNNDKTEVNSMSEAIQKGVLKTWKDDRGFGFIQPDNGDKDIFVHISALRGMARRPVRGDVLFYEVGRDAGGKFKAVNARIEGVEIIEASTKSNKKWLWIIAATLGLVSGAAAYAYYIQ